MIMMTEHAQVELHLHWSVVFCRFTWQVLTCEMPGWQTRGTRYYPGILLVLGNDSKLSRGQRLFYYPGGTGRARSVAGVHAALLVCSGPGVIIGVA